jgi:myo-inositol-1(or 4)-monophosphatase
MPDIAGIRMEGSAALSLAYVAAGRLDAYWSSDLEAWDMAAGALIVREAGGIVTDISGAEGFLESGNIVAGNLKVIRQLLPKLK